MSSDPLDGLPEQAPDHTDSAALEQFYEDVLIHFIMRVEDGEKPDLDEYLARYPRHAEMLAELLSEDSVAPSGFVSPTTSTRERVRGWSMRTIGDYEILFHVASGGGGRVYKARRSRDGLPVALKVLSARESIDPRELARFKREAEMLAALDLRGVIRLLDLSEWNDIFYMALPWIEGLTLQEVVRTLNGETVFPAIDRSEFTHLRLMNILSESAKILHCVHERGILHRDIKPSNIMVNGDFRPILIDFGIARDEERTHLTVTKDAPLGTPRFLAPELLLGDAKAATVWTEIYALGVTAYEVLAREPAFSADSRRELYRQISKGVPDNLRALNPQVSRTTAQVIRRAVDPDPRRRFSDMGAFARALDQSNRSFFASWFSRRK